MNKFQKELQEAFSVNPYTATLCTEEGRKNHLLKEYIEKHGEPPEKLNPEEFLLDEGVFLSTYLRGIIIDDAASRFPSGIEELLDKNGQVAKDLADLRKTLDEPVYRQPSNMSEETKAEITNIAERTKEQLQRIFNSDKL